jgi:hypothetical protein
MAHRSRLLVVVSGAHVAREVAPPSAMAQVSARTVAILDPSGCLTVRQDVTAASLPLPALPLTQAQTARQFLRRPKPDCAVHQALR